MNPENKEREPGPTRPVKGHTDLPRGTDGAGPEATTSASGPNGSGDLTGGGQGHEKRRDQEDG